MSDILKDNAQPVFNLERLVGQRSMTTLADDLSNEGCHEYGRTPQLPNIDKLNDESPVKTLAESGYRPTDLERLVVVRNPVTTNADQWRRHVDDLAEIPRFGNPRVITTEAQIADTIDKLANELRDGDLVFVWSGDGGTNDAVQFMGSRDAPRTALMASEAGDARNFRKATIHDEWNGRPSEVVKHGSFSTIYPLRISVEGLQNYTQLALTVAGAGAMAMGAEVLDDPKHRNHWLRKNPHTRSMYQRYVALKTLPKIHELEVEDAHGELMSLTDINAFAAPIIAKDFKFDTQIDNPDFLVGIIKGDRPHQLLQAIIKMRKGELPVRRITNDSEAITFKLTHSHNNRQARIHVDGKSQPLVPGSQVTIDQVRHGRSVYRPIDTITARRAI